MNIFKKTTVFVLSAVFLFSSVFTPASAITLDELQNQIQSLLNQVKQMRNQNHATVIDAWCFDFKTNIRMGDIGGQVSRLQIALEKEGFTIRNLEKQSNEFGDSTKKAIIAFQEKYKDEILTPMDKTSGTGFVGLTTRVKLNQLYGCGVQTQPSITTISPLSGLVGTKVTLKGANFTVTDNMIKFGPVAIGGLSAEPDNALIYPPRYNTLSFVVPESGSPYCSTGEMCPRSFIKIIPGAYEVQVINKNGVSNSVDFTVTGATTTQPSITVLSPNGGEKWQRGETYTLRWTKNNLSSVNFIALFTGNTKTEILWGRDFSDNKLQFMVPDDMEIRDDYRLIVADDHPGPDCGGDTWGPTCGPNDSSDAPFSIVADASQHMTLDRISPVQGAIGTAVHLEGKGFAPADNRIIFASKHIGNEGKLIQIVDSKNGTDIDFTVPANFLPNQCLYPEMCKPGTEMPINPDNYKVLIFNGLNGYSTNSLDFTVDKDDRCYDFNRNLKRGDTGQNVSALQTILEKEGFVINQTEKINSRFGASTKQAVIGFQEKYFKAILDPINETQGTGFVGKATIIVLNGLYGCNRITVLSPNGGEMWKLGESYQITWSGPKTRYMVKLRGKEKKDSLIGAGVKSPFTYSPQQDILPGEYIIEVCDSYYAAGSFKCDASDKSFMITNNIFPR